MIDPADDFNESELRWLAAFRNGPCDLQGF